MRCSPIKGPAVLLRLLGPGFAALGAQRRLCWPLGVSIRVRSWSPALLGACCRVRGAQLLALWGHHHHGAVAVWAD